MPTKLVFVYNADSGLFNTVADIAHKVLSPKTYPCQLCALTHSLFSVRDEWTGFLEKLNAECEFLHRDEFEKRHGINGAALPTIFSKEDNKLTVFMSRYEINRCEDLTTLKRALQEKLTTKQTSA